MTQGSVDSASSAFRIAVGTCCWISTQLKGAAIAMISMTCAVWRPVSHSVSQNARMPSSR